jgi:hypothetical protein
MAFVVMAFMTVIVAFVLVARRSLSCFWLKVVFDGVGRTQRFAFQARRSEPIALPLWRFPGGMLTL